MATTNLSHPDRFMKQMEVSYVTGVPKSTLYFWMKQGRFPKPRKLGARAVAWRESDINDWLASRQQAA